MKSNHYLSLIIFSVMITVAACKKEAATTTGKSASTGTIALTTINSISSGTKDTLYLVNCFSPHSSIDTIAAANLPATITSYLTTNYSGYTFTKAYTVLDSLKTITNYIVVIKYNSNFVGLKFKADGTFVNVLEQRAGADLHGKGWHEGGPFGDRDGKHRDTIALSALPAAVTTYFTTNYPSDTLLHASITPDSTYLLLSKNQVLYATNITATGTFISRMQLEQHGGRHSSIAQANLPSAITTYLTATYPGYVFDKAYSESINGVVSGYDVFVTVNSTRYVIDFDAGGNFVKAMAIR